MPSRAEVSQGVAGRKETAGEVESGKGRARDRVREGGDASRALPRMPYSLRLSAEEDDIFLAFRGE